MQGKGDIFKELLSKQLKNIQPNKKLLFSDLKRICKYIDTSIFDEDNCCIWNGYITNENNASKGTYINFYFKKKKMALHRLLYINFIETLTDSSYLKFNCDNKGNCCNIYHLKKFNYNTTNNKYTDNIIKKNKKKKKIKIKEPTDFVINFD